MTPDLDSTFDHLVRQGRLRPEHSADFAEIYRARTDRLRADPRVLDEIINSTIASVAQRYRSAGAHSGPVDWDNPAAVDARAQAFVRQGMEYSDALTYMREQEAAPITGDGVISESAALDGRVCAYMRDKGMRSDQYVEALHAVVAADVRDPDRRDPPRQ
jgi:hypothetical protein